MNITDVRVRKVTKEGKMKEYIDLKIIKNKVISLKIEEEPKKEINNSKIYIELEK